MEETSLTKCKSWHDWLGETLRSSLKFKSLGSESPQKKEETLDDEASWEMWFVPSPIPRSVTASQLREASMLVRDGFCTNEELERLKETIANTTDESIFVQGGNVADGLLKLSEAYASSKEVRCRCRAAVDRGLYPTDSERLRYAAVRRTAKLAITIAASVSKGELDNSCMTNVLDHAGLAREEQAKNAADRFITLGHAALRSELTRAQILQLNHVQHAIITLLLRSDLEELEEDGSLVENGISKGVHIIPLVSVSPLLKEDESWEPAFRGNRRVSQPTSPRFDDYQCVLGRSLPYLCADGVVRYYESRTRHGIRLQACNRLWAVSDLHADVAKNREWVRALPLRQQDAIIVAGDIASKLADLETNLTLLASKFKYVFYTFGNHELFLTPPGYATSVHKMFEILNLCDSLGIITSSAFLGSDVLVVPMFSWYRRRGPDAGLLEFFDAACKWPWNIESSLDDAVANFFFKLNEGTLRFCAEMRSKLFSSNNSDPPLVSFSHFVPYIDHLFPGFVAFRHVMGAPELDDQINSLSPLVHVFGHSHINVDEIVHGTRFVENALGHPQETSDEERAAIRPILVWAKAGTLQAAAQKRTPLLEVRHQSQDIDVPTSPAHSQEEDDEDRPSF
uniref:Calcineurin-like phosphoesterase domain-containing protein n=1 Tax=Aureoumbra lagunensis TaxID=44058 RepID=A0A7S3K0D4_9STRA|mmetsp:Transcript_15627/g.23522  ORF Transcript_15627/g.23522 Transcript_15627/m.23522 type:complete len:625 (-) Transcript_15627:58-1932(-)